MKKMWGKTSGKRYLFFTLAAFVMVGSLISPSYGEEARKTKFGFSIFGGMGDALRNEPDFTVCGVLPRVGFPLYKNFDLEFEGNYSYWDFRKEHNFYFLGADANLLFRPVQTKWGSLFLLGGIGMGYDSAGKRVKQIGDSRCGGILQAGAGFYYNLGKGTALRVEYRFYHVSDPFRSDTGLNSHNALLGISF